MALIISPRRNPPRHSAWFGWRKATFMWVYKSTEKFEVLGAWQAHH
jgi:hypothetical protein